MAIATALIAGGIAAAGAVGGAAIGAKATSKASKAQAASSAAQTANANANRDYQYSLNSPVINRGLDADSRIASLLNLGGDTEAARAGFDAYRGSTGYEFRVGQGTGAINSNAYARGMGNSGATLKALTSFGQNIASDEFGRYLGQLGGVSAGGANARSLVAGIGQNNVNTQNMASQNLATVQGNAAIANGNNFSNALGQLVQAGGYALGSSYQQPQSQMLPRQQPIWERPTQAGSWI